MSCEAPLDHAYLTSYWLGELPPDQEELIEQHLLSCSDCSSALEQIVAMDRGIRKLARTGELRVIVSQAFLERLSAEGLRVRQYAPPAGGSVACTVTSRDDLLMARLAADLRDAGQVDLIVCDAAGAERGRLRDIPVSLVANEVILNEPMHIARALPVSTHILKLVSAQDQSEQVLAEYVFQHTPSDS